MNQEHDNDDDMSVSVEEQRDHDHNNNDEDPLRSRMPSVHNTNPVTSDRSMEITSTEREWALALKEKVEQSEELVCMSDFAYAHYAIVTHGDLQDALIRIHRMQAYQQYYKVDGTPEQGLQCLCELMEQQPGFLLHVDVDPGRQASIHAIDLGSLNPTVALGYDANGKENWRTFTLGMYYIFYCGQTSLEVIRNGFYALVDFADITSDNYSPECQRKVFEEVVRFYPFTWRHFLAYNTGHWANIKISMAKRMMPEGLRRAVQSGCQILESDESRNPTAKLKQFYLMPSREEAERKVLVLAKEHLEMRAYNERIFRL